MTLRDQARTWLADHAVPLWFGRGIDWEGGGFFENLSRTGHPLTESPKRTMVQARQIYSARIATELGMLSPSEAARAVRHGADFLLRNAFLPSGAIAHCLRRDGHILDATPDLYAQAFAVFGMANAFCVDPRRQYRDAAVGVLGYLKSRRRAQAGGYLETSQGSLLSNPHMHLFEAALAWTEIDPDPLWAAFAEELFELCSTRLVDTRTGLLAEHFDDHWKPITPDGRFVLEPGHQYEWAWLLHRYDPEDRRGSKALWERLFRLAETHGIDPAHASAIDELWSDLTPKRRSARFWPQCERIKAAVSFGAREAADQALATLFRYLETPTPGLWHDARTAEGAFAGDPVKASSLYHIIGAMSAYLRLPEDRDRFRSGL